MPSKSALDPRNVSVSKKPRKPVKVALAEAESIMADAEAIKAAKQAGVRRVCTGKSVVRDDEGQAIRDADGKALMRPCKRTPIRGGMVCWAHGGSAPQVKARAEKTPLGMVDRALVVLGELAEQTDHPPTQLGAVKEIFNRAGTKALGPVSESTGDGGNKGPSVQICIMPGGIGPAPTVAVRLPHQLTAGADDSVDADVVDDDDDE